MGVLPETVAGPAGEAPDPGTVEGRDVPQARNRARDPRARDGAGRSTAMNRSCLLVLLVTMLGVRTAWGQTPPAGNAHPESHRLSAMDGELSNPFGKPETDPRTSAPDS